MPTEIEQKKPSKAQQVETLLKRSRGATVTEMASATSWQAHSVRAFLTGLRKKGHTVTKDERKPGLVAYRIGAPAAEPSAPAPSSSAAADEKASA